MKVLESKTFNKTYQKDLTLMVLVKSLYDVSTKEFTDKSGIIEHELNFPEGYQEMIDGQVELLCKKIQTTLENAMIKFPINNFKERSQIEIVQVLEWLSNNDIEVHLDVLASYILYYAFHQREVVYDHFEGYTNKEMYSLVVDTLDEAGLPLMTKIKMSKIAKEIISRVS